MRSPSERLVAFCPHPTPPQHADHARAYGDEMEPREPKDDMDGAEERDERIRHLYGSAFGDGQQRGGGGDDAECAAGDG